MTKFIAGFFSALFLAGNVLAQTPTPIQPRKNIQPAPANDVTVMATPPSTPIKESDLSYCANSMRVFHGIVTYNPEYQQYSVKFRYTLCFTNGKEVYKISRIFLLPSDPLLYNQFFWTSVANQPVRLMLLDYKIIHIGLVNEIVATNFDIVKDD